MRVSLRANVFQLDDIAALEAALERTLTRNLSTSKISLPSIHPF